MDYVPVIPTTVVDPSTAVDGPATAVDGPAVDGPATAVDDPATAVLATAVLATVVLLWNFLYLYLRRYATMQATRKLTVEVQ